MNTAEKLEPEAPDFVPIPRLLADCIDQVLEAEQKRTKERAGDIRRRYREEHLQLLRDWLVRKQREEGIAT